VEQVPQKRSYRNSGGAAPLGGLVWFAGWLFTIAYVNLVWWKMILALVVWPYYLGAAVR
jgi:hypothetical protein